MSKREISKCASISVTAAMLWFVSSRIRRALANLAQKHASELGGRRLASSGQLLPGRRRQWRRRAVRQSQRRRGRHSTLPTRLLRRRYRVPRPSRSRHRFSRPRRSRSPGRKAFIAQWTCMFQLLTDFLLFFQTSGMVFSISLFKLIE